MAPLYGLVLAGGKSSRMQRDKALLAYHGENQVQRTAALLGEVCPEVFLSLRPDGDPAEYGVDLQPVHDSFGESGPLGGILSAQAAHPEAAWLVAACDLPFLPAATLRYLVDHRAPDQMATAFASSHDGLPEPLCAIYEPHSHRSLIRYFEAGRLCPRKILIEEKINLLPLPDPQALDNVNTREEYRTALLRLRGNAQT